MRFIVKSSSKYKFSFGLKNHLRSGNIYFDCVENRCHATNDYLLLGSKQNLTGEVIQYFYEPNKLHLRLSGEQYYFLSINKNKLLISSNFLNILPIYIYKGQDYFIVSSCINLIKKHISSLTINKKYLLEHNLFNYSFSNSTIFNEVNLIKANSYLVLDENLTIHSLKPIEHYFTETPKSWRKSIDNLTEQFIELNKNLFKDKDYISLTSGFDGRTLVSLAKHLKKDVNAFSFGTEKNDDLTLPRLQSRMLNINFLPINLDTRSYYEKFWGIGSEIINENGVATNFLQVHWPYSAKLLLEYTGRVISGVFGSELFRAAHIAGQFTSPALVDYFKYIKTDEWINKLKNANSLVFLNMDNFKNELIEIIDELNDYKKSTNDLLSNQRFYKYLIEEVFRKFFGLQFLNPQFKYINVLTPYLDLRFVKELFQTELAGVYNEFFTHNPIKRYKGQLFYAKVMEKTYPELLRMKTGKGYSPHDLLSFFGKSKIVIGYLNKRLSRKLVAQNLDNLSIISSFAYNRKKFKSIEINKELYNNSLLTNLMQNRRVLETNILIRDKFIETLSINYYIGKLQ